LWGAIEPWNWKRKSLIFYILKKKTATTSYTPHMSILLRPKIKRKTKPIHITTQSSRTHIPFKCHIGRRFFIPPPMYPFYPSWRQKKFDKRKSNFFFNANLSKIYTNKKFGLRLSNFFEVKKIYGGGKSSHHIRMTFTFDTLPIFSHVLKIYQHIFICYLSNRYIQKYSIIKHFLFK
jgi:hypothetical protein